MEVKVVVSYPDGTSEQKELKGGEAERFLGYRIGDTVEGSLVGIEGTLQVTGGSDKDGFPMKKGGYGTRRMKLLLATGIGYNPTDEGVRKKKRVRSDTISEEIVQINTKVLAAPKAEAAPEPVEAPVEAPVEEAPAQEEEATVAEDADEQAE
jgi:small subunit ribosomal protein S6e